MSVYNIHLHVHIFGPYCADVHDTLVYLLTHDTHIHMHTYTHIRVYINDNNKSEGIKRV